MMNFMKADGHRLVGLLSAAGLDAATQFRGDALGAQVDDAVFGQRDVKTVSCVLAGGSSARELNKFLNCSIVLGKVCNTLLALGIGHWAGFECACLRKAELL